MCVCRCVCVSVGVGVGLNTELRVCVCVCVMGRVKQEIHIAECWGQAWRGVEGERGGGL